MTPVTDEEFEELLHRGFEREALHLEMRDAYGTAVELPHMAKWASGEPDDLEWLQGWCATLSEHVKAGRCVRRARVVSEPLSDYQRWSYSIAYPMVEAGEDIRWVSRRLVSSVALPGNDFYLFDDRLAVFLLYAGNGLGVGKVRSAEPADLRLCRSSFEAAWKLSIPHREYAPVYLGQGSAAGAGRPSPGDPQGRGPFGAGAGRGHRPAFHAGQQDRARRAGAFRSGHP